MTKAGRRLRDAIRQGDVATAVSCAIESNDDDTDIIMVGLTLMLGNAGLEAHAVDAARILRSGKLPFVALLVERKVAASRR